MTQNWWLIMITFSVKPVLHQSKEWSSFSKIKQLLITWPKVDMFHTQVIHKGGFLSSKKSYNHIISWKLISRYGKLLRSCCQRRRNNCFVERKHGHVWKTILIFIIYYYFSTFLNGIWQSNNVIFSNVSKPISFDISQLKLFLFPARINIKAGLPMFPSHTFRHIFYDDDHRLWFIVYESKLDLFM